uniref:Restriction endonuclease type IV Mrr domain-containing protein n=1 Tax=viral metagenome TaxID=1070528 RepID=A0A6C0CJJ4_9ZZZZ
MKIIIDFDKLDHPPFGSILSKLEQKSKSERIEYLLKYFQIGVKVMDCISVSANNNQISKIDDGINSITHTLNQQTSSYDRLQHSLDLLNGKVNKSIEKGTLTENIINNHLQTLFPMDDIKDMSGFKEKCDIWMECHDSSHRILYEIKNYTNPVPQPQIETFYKSLEKNNASAGIFIATRGIYGKTSLDFRYHNDIPVVFVPNNDLYSGAGVMWATVFIKRILELKSKSNDSDIGEIDLKVLWDNTKHILEHLQESLKTIDELAKNAREVRKISDGMNTLLKNLRSSISEKLDELKSHILKDL